MSTSSNIIHFIVRLGCSGLSALLVSGCSTMYFHNNHANTNDHQAINELMEKAEASLEHTAIQHDGVIALVNDNSIVLEAKCIDGKWQSIKTQNTTMDMIIRFIGNPIYGTSTVKYDCKPIDKTLAQHLINQARINQAGANQEESSYFEQN